MRNPLIGLVSAVVLTSTMATNGCGSSPSGGGAGNTGGGRANNGGISGGGSNGNGGISGGGSSGNGGISSRGSSGNGGISSGGSSGNGGSPGSGGSAGSTGECPGMTPCGGDVVGTWTVTSSCLNVTGELDMSLAVGPACPSGPITGSLQVTGTWTANPNGTYMDNTTTSGDEQLTLASACLVISSTQTDCGGAASLLKSVLGYSDLNCPSAAGGGCNCSGTAKQTGTIGLLSPGPADKRQLHDLGQRAHNFGRLGRHVKYSYCVSGNKLTLTPQSTKPTMTGTIVLQKSSSSGSGGATGSGGQGGSGGKSGAGGATGGGGTGGATGQARCGRQERRRRSHWRRWLRGHPGGTAGGPAAAARGLVISMQLPTCHASPRTVWRVLSTARTTGSSIRSGARTTPRRTS